MIQERLGGCLYEVRHTARVGSQHKGEFHFLKAVYMRMNSYPLNEILPQHGTFPLGEMICLHVNSFPGLSHLGRIVS